MITEKLAWQTGYAAYSVSESGVEQVYQYIADQKVHHRKSLFEEDYKAFIKLYSSDGHLENLQTKDSREKDWNRFLNYKKGLQRIFS